MNAACEALLAKETQRSFEEGRARGYREGRADERAAFEAQAKAGETERIAHAARLTESIHAERTRHLEAVEHEVVKLAMAIAARILRREAQVDRLLLTGAVRVALGQLSASSQVRLKVPAADLDLWTESIALLPNLAVKPVVVAGEGMRLGDCVAETEVGSVDLGVKAQLGEIEHALFKGASGGAAPAATSAAGGEEEK
jgi:flagellar assembly protein FliH